MKAGENWSSGFREEERFYTCIHVQSPGARADTTWGQNFDCNLKALLL